MTQSAKKEKKLESQDSPKRSDYTYSVIKNYEIGNLYFGQLNPMHQDFFDSLYCQHTRIRVRNLPHYIIWRDDEWRKPRKSLYYRYLEQSWKYYMPDKNDHENRTEKIKKYINLKNNINKKGIEEPVEIVLAPDGSKIIVSGNHRASIAYYLGIDLPCKITSITGYLKYIVENSNEFYGTKNNNIPCQSIIYKEKELLKGRRSDVLSRFYKIDAEDIKGKSVLDTGANIGMNAILAWQYGAKSVTAIEYSPKIATAALRLSTLLDSNIDLQVQDMGTRIDNKKKFDTVFCFSLYSHVKNKRRLEKNLINKTSGTLYFEGHPKTKKQDYHHILHHFREVELLGYNEDGIHNKKSTRPFFRCEK